MQQQDLREVHLDACAAQLGHKVVYKAAYHLPELLRVALIRKDGTRHRVPEVWQDELYLGVGWG